MSARSCVVCGESGHEFCDYFGPLFVRCDECGWMSRDELTMDVVNDLTGVCPVCGSARVVFGSDDAVGVTCNGCGDYFDDEAAFDGHVCADSVGE